MHESFYNQVSFPSHLTKRSFNHRFALVGSCFSQHIYEKFRDFGFKAMGSPFGTVYNPISIVNQLDIIVDLNHKLTLDSFLDSSINWEFAHSFQAQNTDNISHFVQEWHTQLKQTNVLFLTFGSAMVYRLNSNGRIVANCHKQPANIFYRELLETQVMFDTLEVCLKKLKAFNSNMEIVLTVSPVRHLRDGLVVNNRSKARLIDLCGLLEKKGLATYYPVYELVVDELRDYRFFERDGAHPNSLATDVVWDRLTQVLIADEANVLFKKISDLRKMETHRPINPSAEEKLQFENLYQQRKEELNTLASIEW